MFDSEKVQRIILGVVVVLAVVALTMAVNAGKWRGEFEDMRGEAKAYQDTTTTKLDDSADEIEALSGLANKLEVLAGRVNSVESATSQQVNDALGKVADIQSQFDALTFDDAQVGKNKNDIKEFKAEVREELDAIKKALEALESYPDYGELERIAYYTTENGFAVGCLWSPIIVNHWSGQQFKTDYTRFDVRYVNLYLKREAGYSTTLNLRIYATGSNGYPTGSPLFLGTFDASYWLTTPQWHRLDVSGCLLQPNSMYVILLEDVYGTGADHIAWGYNYEGKYTNGTWVKSLDGGATYPIAHGIDAGFEVWGVRK